MASSAEHIELYGALRQSFLTRHFPYNRYFRTNLLFEENRLGALHNHGSQTPNNEDDDTLSTCQTEAVRPGSYADAAALQQLGKTDEAQAVKERSRVAGYGGENHLLLSGQLLTFLAVEYRLGTERQLAKQIILAALSTFGSLYKFDGDYAGYPIRWDATTTDQWRTKEVDGRPHPTVCCQFLVNEKGSGYLYCTPLDHPYYQGDKNRLRGWEPSMDELVGLILAYFIVDHLVDDPEVHAEVSHQVTNLGNYLAEHGYLLVRPCGNFTARGAAGLLPTMEYAFARTFERITGRRFDSRATFERALEQAGLWDKFTGKLFWASVIGGVLTVLLSPFTLTSGIVLSLFFGEEFIPIALMPYIAMRAQVFEREKHLFEAMDDKAASEFAPAYIFKWMGSENRLRYFFRATALGGGGASATGFPPFVGLTALEDSNRTVAKGYLQWLTLRRAFTTIGLVSDDGMGEDEGVKINPFASAVAVVLGAGSNEEQRLKRHLDDAYTKLTGEAPGYGGDLQLKDVGSTTQEVFRPSLQYLAALALAWLHADKQQAAGRDLPDGFPTPPEANHEWPPLMVPTSVQAAAFSGEITVPKDEADRWERDWKEDEYWPGHLYPGKVPRKPAADPVPEMFPEDQKYWVELRRHVVVNESDWAVDTGLNIQAEDLLQIEAEGKIWAGVLGTGTNGPEGWTNLDRDEKFPLPGSHPFCLLYALCKKETRVRFGIETEVWSRVGPYVYAGDNPKLQQQIGVPTTRLFLRTNDDSPGNGSGHFDCYISIKRVPVEGPQ